MTRSVCVDRKWYLASFLMSVAWIAVLSFAMVTLVGRTGCILNIDSYVMGLVVIAVGTSIPVIQRHTCRLLYEYNSWKFAVTVSRSRLGCTTKIGCFRTR